MEDRIPPLHSIFYGEVASVQTYGAFVKIPGCKKQGLVHKSQMSSARVEDPSEMLAKGEKVHCKIIGMEGEGEKISLSMKLVNQTTGEDLDPNNVQLDQDSKKRREWKHIGKNKIELGAELNTTCKKCGGHGHLTMDCFSSKGGTQYDLIPDIDELTKLPPKDDLVVARQGKKKKKKEKKKSKKLKKRKRSVPSSSSGSGSEDGDSGSDYRDRQKRSPRQKKSRKRKRDLDEKKIKERHEGIKRRQRSNSPSSVSSYDKICRNSSDDNSDDEVGNEGQMHGEYGRHKDDRAKHIEKRKDREREYTKTKDRHKQISDRTKDSHSSAGRERAERRGHCRDDSGSRGRDHHRFDEKDQKRGYANTEKFHIKHDVKRHKSRSLSRDRGRHGSR